MENSRNESTNEEAMDISPIELLPTEILQKILSYLPVRDRVRVERVCKRWKNVSDERIWRDVQVLVIGQWLKEEYNLMCYTLSELREFGRFHPPKSYELTTNVTELGMIRSLVSRAGQHVKEFIFDLDLENENGTPVLTIIAKHCHNIESFHLLRANESDINAFLRLLENNKQLDSITCCFNADIFFRMLPLRDWKSLHFVDFIFFEREYSYDIEDEQWEEAVVALIENSPSLEQFYVYGWTPRIVTAISKCKQLKDLFLPIEDDVATKNLVMYTPLVNRLTCLKVERRYDDADSLINLLSHCTNLESLHLLYWEYEIPDAVQEAVLALPKLESLELDVPYLTDDFLNRLLKFKYLRLSNPNSITDNGILKIIKNSECLEKLEIPNIVVTTETFERLVEETRNRRGILTIRVDSRVYEEALEICKGSRIQIFRECHDLVNEIRHWRS